MALDDQLARTPLERIGIGAGLALGLFGAIATREYPITGTFVSIGGCIGAIGASLPYVYRLRASEDDAHGDVHGPRSYDA